MSDELPDDLPDDVPGARFERGKRHVGLLAGPALAALVAVLDRGGPAPALSALMTLAIVWWLTEALPAAVPFYGIPPAPDWSQVDVPILAHVAARDGWVTPAAAEKIQETLAALGKRMDLHVYDADHAFMNEQRPEVYSPEDARVAWDRTIDFLRAHTA